MNWTNIIGNEWYSLLKDFVESEKMLKIVQSVAKERVKYTVYPIKDEFYKMFKIFKDIQPSDIKCIILEQDPHSDGSFTGYAFDNAGKLPSDINPNLKNIFNKIREEDTEKEKLCLDEMDLSRWVNQGVFLVNSYLTVRKGAPGLHTFWIPFTEYWIDKLNIYDDIIWLLMGTKAIEYSNLIKNNTHEIIKTSHSSPLGASKEGKDYPSFHNSKPFSKINNSLWVRNKEMIKW
jgi:uracil-DNA glycosylase